MQIIAGQIKEKMNGVVQKMKPETMLVIIKSGLVIIALECKQYAGGPWKKYLKPPVRCAPDKWTPNWSSWDGSKSWCNNYHKTLERKKIHLKYRARGCKKYSPKWGEHQTNKPCIKYVLVRRM